MATTFFDCTVPVAPTMLRFSSPEEHSVPIERHQALLSEFREVLLDRGMASMDEYGDMLKWGLPGRDGMCRYFHVYHPGYCSFSDAFRGTIHYHGGEIRGTILLGVMEHDTYEATASVDGDRWLAGTRYSLRRHAVVQRAGTAYRLPAFVPHWLRPLDLTVTYFEEEDNDVMGDLLEPEGEETDEHFWTQADAEALLPGLVASIDAMLAGTLQTVVAD